MNDTRRNKSIGTGVLVRGNDIDTDRIIPARYLRTVTFEGLGEHAFEDDRAQLRNAGKTHPFDDPRFCKGEILFVNKNFGCGSSREHAPQALNRWGRGIKALVGESFAEIFYGNCIALGMPCPVVTEGDIERLMQAIETDPSAQVELDLSELSVSVGGLKVPIDIPPGPRKQFIEGRWDSTTELLDAQQLVKERLAQIPYIKGY